MKYDVEVDWKNPGAAYLAIFKERGRRWMKMRALNESQMRELKAYYKEHIADFISDWGMTYEPRNVERGLPAMVPFVLFDKQIEYVNWVLDRWKKQENGVAKKSRDMGISWLNVAISCGLCLFYDGMAVGFGSRKEEYVDRIGSMKALFPKARMFMQYLPPELRGGFEVDKHAPHMRLYFPESKSMMSGEAGDNIGRGDRTGIYLVDESAFLERPELIDAALSQTTNCRIDVSSANGTANTFYEKVTEYPEHRVFTFHWRDDPRKDDAWYQKQVNDLDPVIVAQEIDIDFAASVEGVLIPSAWVQASVDAHLKLGFHPSGERRGGLDVADEGRDTNCFIGMHGVVVEVMDEWSGKGADIYATTAKAFSLCDSFNYRMFKYDADGLGAGVRGDARVLNSQRKHGKTLEVLPFRGSGKVEDPDKKVEGHQDRTNADMFANAKAQAWWWLRTRFKKTYEAVVDGLHYDPDELISIPSGLKNRNRLTTQLSQPTYGLTEAGKIKIEKAPDGMASPNCADALMICSARSKRGLFIPAEALRRSAMNIPSQTRWNNVQSFFK